jgi:PST family polysaccharide transporter
MLLLTIVQRGLGFFRGIWFCRHLDDTAVGQWSMALGFITMITPLMMLGLSGAMPRYVERYRMEGQLPHFIRRVLAGTLLGSALVMIAMLSAPEFFSWLIFRHTENPSLVYTIVIAVGTVLIFNFIIELVSSLRQLRTVSMMHFCQGVGFTILGISVIYTGGSIEKIVGAFALSMVIATLPGLRVLLKNWAGLPRSETPFDSREMWRVLLPYASALWVMNLLTNMFELSDRYMILHFMPGDGETARAAVGQYHSGGLIPVLLTSLATMFGGALMPYLAAEWEQGEKAKVQQRLTRSLFVLSVGFTACAAIVITISPWLFENLLGGRYREGLAIQPMIFTICIWVAVVTVSQNYLWLQERGGLIGWSLAIGLAVNIVLNRLLVPHFGLQGAVLATLVANGTVLLGVGAALRHVGFQMDRSILWTALVPISLMVNGSVAICVAIASIVLCRDAQYWLIEWLESASLRTRGTVSNPASR